jgi:eukaryotic-like serine/threonine-protein kinase
MPGANPLLAADPGRIGRYRLAGRLNGRGGGRRADDKAAGGLHSSGTAPFVVYLGRAADGEPVTIILLQPLRAGDTAARDRFVAEANAAREVAPFCVARMLDAGFHGDFPYLVCEHVPGPSLEEVIAAQGPAEEGVLRAIAIGAATGLAAIHQAGLVHGQFGPRQLVLGPDGPRVVHSGVTPPYGLATPAADVLSWARAVLFAATGKKRPDMIAPGPGELRLLQSPIRQLVTECAALDPAARPPAKVLVTRLLGHGQPPAGILAAGSRAADPARTPVRAGDTAGEPTPGAGVRGQALQRARLPGRMIAGAAIAVAAVIVAVMSVVLLGQHGAAPAPTRTRPDKSLSTGTPAASPTALPPSAGLPIPASLSGTWSGQVQQANPPLSFVAQIQLSGGQRAGTVSYPSFGCSGVLTLTSQSAASFVFRQGIVSGQQTCGQGTVTLRKAGNALSFAFTPATPGGPGSYGTLSRQ